jgi:hypothetical protein
LLLPVNQKMLKLFEDFQAFLHRRSPPPRELSFMGTVYCLLHVIDTRAFEFTQRLAGSGIRYIDPTSTDLGISCH